MTVIVGGACPVSAGRPVIVAPRAVALEWAVLLEGRCPLPSPVIDDEVKIPYSSRYRLPLESIVLEVSLQYS